MPCTRCHAPNIVYRRRYSGEALCAHCFNHSIVEKVRRTLGRYSMLRHGDLVAVAVSGGKDSLSLLHILAQLSRDHGSQLVAVTIDEGIPGYREEAVENTGKMVESLQIPLHVYTFKELYGVTTEEALQVRGEAGPPSCTICGVLRRRALEGAAHRVGATVVATGHNLDDFIQTFLLNLFTGGLNRIYRLDPDLLPVEASFLRRVKPLLELYEEEVAFYAFLNGLPLQSSRCPHVEEGLRDQVREFLNRLEAQRPGIKYNLFHATLELSKRLQSGEEGPLQRCTVCGQPSSQPLCSPCRILRNLAVPH